MNLHRRIEQKLVGDRKMVLTSQPSELARRLKHLPGVDKIEILQAPYAALRYRTYLQAKIKKEDEMIEDGSMPQGKKLQLIQNSVVMIIKNLSFFQLN